MSTFVGPVFSGMMLLISAQIPTFVTSVLRRMSLLARAETPIFFYLSIRSDVFADPIP